MRYPASSNTRTPIDRHVLWLIILITWLSFATRVINLSGDSFWYDELLTFNTAQLPIERILAERAADRPPGYYALEHYAAQWWGANEFGLRLTSALAGTLTIPLAFVAGSIIANRRVGLGLAVLMAVSNALGTWLHDYPLTPDKILRVLGKVPDARKEDAPEGKL